MKNINGSGITPCGNRIVVKPDEIKETVGEESKIIVPDSVRESHMHAQSTGVLVAAGPDAFRHTVSTTHRRIDDRWVPYETKVSGYSEDFAKVGERVAFAKYGGLQVEGEDGVNYRILNDEDITARVSDGVNFTDIKTRERVSAA